MARWIRLTVAIVLLIVGVNIVAADHPGYWTLVAGGCFGTYTVLVMGASDAVTGKEK